VHVRFISTLPTAAVNPKDNGQVFGLGRRIHIEDLKLIRVLGVRDIAFDLLSMGRDQKHDGAQKTNDMLHCVDPLERRNVAIQRLQIAVLNGESGGNRGGPGGGAATTIDSAARWSRQTALHVLMSLQPKNGNRLGDVGDRPEEAIEIGDGLDGVDKSSKPSGRS
jgi:hypothetical protein